MAAVSPSQPGSKEPEVALQRLDALPPELLDREAHELARYLGGPTLIDLGGEREPPLFVSVLLHGNETVGWDAVRSLLQRQRSRARAQDLPRALSLFIGNVAAAASGQRHLAEQPDYNRVWPGSELPETTEHRMMAELVGITRRRGLFASIDIHNNTGWNPHYTCVNRLDHRSLHLATLFSRTVVYFLRPKGVQSMAMAGIAPAVTLECGKVGQRHGAAHASDYLDACLRLSSLPVHPVPSHDIDLFHTVAQVRVPEGVSFRFGPGESAAEIIFEPDLDRLNFRELAPGTSIGQVAGRSHAWLDARDEQGRDVTARYFEIENGEIRFRVPVMPSMLTRNLEVIRQDCLGYLMERYNDHLPRGPQST